MNSKIKVIGGSLYDYLLPKEEDITIDIISHSLSKEQRFGNMLDGDWSVLQHVLLVTEILRLAGASKEEQLIGLHHDDPEAWMGDMPTPLKNLCKDYRKLYDRCTVQVEKKLGIPLRNLPIAVKAADRFAMHIEDVLFSDSSSDWHNVTVSQIERPILLYIVYLCSRPKSYLVELYNKKNKELTNA